MNSIKCNREKKENGLVIETQSIENTHITKENEFTKHVTHATYAVFNALLFFSFRFYTQLPNQISFSIFFSLFLLFLSSCLNMQQQHIQSIFIWIQFRLIDSIKPKDSKRKIHFKQKLLYYSLFLTAIQFFFSLFNVCQSTNKAYNIIQ